jgi:hypothetical protein
MRGPGERRGSLASLCSLALFVALAGCGQAGPSAHTSAGTSALPMSTPPSTAAGRTADPPSSLPASPDPCPSSSPLRVSELTEADLSCFGSNDVAVLGWVAKPPIFGVLPPGIQPKWLWWGVIVSVLWDHPRDGLTDLECSQGNCPAYAVMHVPPGSNLTLGRNGRWVLVRGHRSDPLAEKCRYAYPPDWGNQDRAPDEQARQTCRESFVMTSIVPATPPAE